VIAGPVAGMASVVPAFRPISDALKSAIRDGLKDALAGKSQDKMRGKAGGKGRKPRN
jgi:ribosomal protein L4